MAELLLDFTADLSVGSILDSANPQVGQTWDLAINGVGLKLYQGDSRDRDHRMRRYTVPLDPDGRQNQDIPFSDSLQRYKFAGWSDFSGGAGQKHRDRPSSSETRYEHSQGVDVFSEFGELTLLNDTELVQAEAEDWVRVVQTDAALYIVTRTLVKVMNTLTDTPTPVAWTPGGAINSVTTDGVQLYISVELDGIWKGDEAGFTQWSTHDVVEVAWLAGGIVVSLKGAGSTEANEFWSMGTDGLFDTEGASVGDDTGALPLLVMPLGWHISQAVFGGGFIWFTAVSYTKSQVYRWRRAGEAVEAPVPVWDLPENELATTCFHYQGQLMVRAAVIDEPDYTPGGGGGGGYKVAALAGEDDTVAARIYRCPIDQAGALVPFLLVEVDEADVHNGNGGWYAQGRFIYYGWAGISDDAAKSGLGIIDLATGGWARHLTSDLAALGRVSSIVEWRNELWFSIDGHGVWRSNETLVKSGYLDTDHADFGTTLTKTVDDYRLILEPLPVGCTVVLQPTFDWGRTYLDLGFMEDRAGASQMIFEQPRSVVSVGMRVVMSSDVATKLTGPVVKVLQFRMHQQGLADQVIEVPVEVTDAYHLRTGAAAPDAKPGYGVFTTKWLESLTQQLVAYQDIDFGWTGDIAVWQVVQVEALPIIEYDTKQGKSTVAGITRVTLRRSLLTV